MTHSKYDDRYLTLVIKRLGWLKELLVEIIKEGSMVFWQVSG